MWNNILYFSIFANIRMKNLVYILPDKDGGVASVVRNLLKFKTDRFETKVILIHNTLDDNSLRVHDAFNADEIIRIKFNGKWSSKQGVMNKIKRHLDQNSILISNDGGMELEVVNNLKFTIPVVYIMHGHYKHYYKCIKNQGYLMDSIITVSDYLKEKIESKFGNKDIISNIDIVSVKFPVPLTIDNPIEKVKSPKIRIAFVGALIEDKGVLFFKDILTQLTELKINFIFNIIGAGHLEEKLKRDLESFSNVHFMGQLTNQEVISMHSEHDILILPSFGEGLPVSIVEAMKCGVIPIATNLKSGIPELIEDGVTGFTVPLAKIEKYGTFIKYLDDNRGKMEIISHKCISKAERLFKPYVQSKAYEDVFINTKPSFTKTKKKNVLHFLPFTIANRINKLKNYGN